MATLQTLTAPSLMAPPVPMAARRALLLAAALLCLLASPGAAQQMDPELYKLMTRAIRACGSDVSFLLGSQPTPVAEQALLLALRRRRGRARLNAARGHPTMHGGGAQRHAADTVVHPIACNRSHASFHPRLPCRAGRSGVHDLHCPRPGHCGRGRQRGDCRGGAGAALCQVRGHVRTVQRFLCCKCLRLLPVTNDQHIKCCKSRRNLLHQGGPAPRCSHGRLYLGSQRVDHPAFAMLNEQPAPPLQVRPGLDR